MQDYVLNYVLAYATNRSSVAPTPTQFVTNASSSFVFDDYTWAVDGTPYSDLNGEIIPSRIPLTALIDGKERSLVLHGC